MKLEISDAFSELVREKNIERETMAEIVQDIFLSMIKKKYGNADNFEVFVNMDKGEIEIYQYKTIVEDVEDPVRQITLPEAQESAPDLEMGEDFMQIVDPTTFGRRLIIAAKQNLNQRIKEIEKELVYDEYKNRVGEIISGDIRQINRDMIYINIDKVEALLPKSEQIPSERYRRGDHLRAVIKSVGLSPRGPEILISRSSEQFLVRLFELEVPEIYEGIIEIKAIAREPGERTKIAVLSNDKRIDAVGACVGMKGMRIQAIVKELSNEKIDIINWSSEPEIFITRALSPAKPMRIAIDEEEHKVIAVLDEDQISLAIGKGGQNRRLASRLTGYEILTVRDEEYRQMMEEGSEEDISIQDVEELSDKIKTTLEDGGFDTVKDVLDAGQKQLMQLPGIGVKTAEKIIAALEEYYEE
jgi:transcription termination/antitermination protein NusA